MASIVLPSRMHWAAQGMLQRLGRPTYVEELLTSRFQKFELRGTPVAEALPRIGMIRASDSSTLLPCIFEDDPYRIPTAYQMARPLSVGKTKQVVMPVRDSMCCASEDEAFDDSKKLLQEALGSSYQALGLRAIFGWRVLWVSVDVFGSVRQTAILDKGSGSGPSMQDKKSKCRYK